MSSDGVDEGLRQVHVLLFDQTSQSLNVVVADEQEAIATESPRIDNFLDHKIDGEEVESNAMLLPMIDCLDQAKIQLGLPEFTDTRPQGSRVSEAKQFLERNMLFLAPFLGDEYERTKLRVGMDYRLSEAAPNSRNKCRNYYNSKGKPLADVVGGGIHRIMLQGSQSGLFPRAVVEFVALLRLLPELNDNDAAILLEAMWIVAGIGECDPTIAIFPANRENG
eukprot:TRINITY_DN9945_c0_g1_i2.p1 TRINITY_DN9945_c0_g1~~TRINITY_DN9945_c0_g1_i2.p1  ORF type:complete len:222 (-),score=62.43 TRINITY_DN9945_c0_g1_i2:77-742(-)